MSELVRVAQVDEIAPGSMKLVDVRGERIAIANVGGSFYAFSDACTHDGGPLSDGDLEGEIVTCPWHFSRFNIRTGEVIDAPAEETVQTYEVRVEGDDVYVGAARGPGAHPPV